MIQFLPRHRWLPAAGVVACLALSAGCSGSSTAPRSADTSPSASAPAAASSATSGTGIDATTAGAALRRVATRVKALRSYQFAASQTLTGGSTPQTTRLSGRAIRPSSVFLTLTTGGRTVQLVGIGAVAYRRVPPAGYKRLVRPSSLRDPLASVTAVLGRLASVASTPTAAGTVFSGMLSGPDAAAAGLVANLTPAPGLTLPVRLTTDRLGRLVRFEFTAPLRAGDRQLVLRQVTTYGGFNAQPPIPRPT